jgi:thioredoxin 1
MKIGVAAKSGSLDAGVSRQFGRCPYFVVVDPDTLAFEAFVNPACQISGGAGPAAVQALTRHGVEIAMAGRFGPKAERALEAAGIRGVVVRGTVREAVRTGARSETDPGVHFAPAPAGERKRGATAGNAIVELNDDNFESRTREGVTLVDFWAPWCAPCLTQAPILERVAATLGDRATIAKFNVTDARATPRAFGILAIPTLLLLVDGAVVERFTGVRSEGALVAAVQEALAIGRR